ncbi:MAG: hypothetical protein HETSPECPRED_006883 [Heterodermia speciosa]|uniref:Effector protein n=1 Tax=Heterodermia speciosa TaxID=116794 RepID=A0A8H3FT17_9LECA|nr:MAG: hypothetical protein HETSPECPRED_006883 [Heterodermia speciosa]
MVLFTVAHLALLAVLQLTLAAPYDADKAIYNRDNAAEPTEEKFPLVYIGKYDNDES